jgi:lipopolysaccharide/colanic/teichoic acid biosynthesis glycosyltransferase
MEGFTIKQSTLVSEAPASDGRVVPLFRVVGEPSPTERGEVRGVYLRFGKRFLDIVLAGLAIVALSPVLILVSLLIWLEDRSPVLYKQTRIGRNGEPFCFVKFRTMRTDADQMRGHLLGRSDAKGPAFKMKRDPRVTRIGRWLRRSSIDELPQLFDVFAGRMSIVGPRPHLPEEVSHYTPEQAIRLQVKPGLFCIREVSGRSELDFDQWLRLDVDYVKNQSFSLDLGLMVRLIPAVLTGRGAY